MQDSIIKEHLKNGAWKKGLYSREWQAELVKDGVGWLANIIVDKAHRGKDWVFK